MYKDQQTNSQTKLQSMFSEIDLIKSDLIGQLVFWTTKFSNIRITKSLKEMDRKWRT